MGVAGALALVKRLVFLLTDSDGISVGTTDGWKLCKLYTCDVTVTSP